MISIDEMKKNRFQFLKSLWELSEHDTRKMFSMNAIGAQLGFDPPLTRIIENYLKEENLVRFVGKKDQDGIIAITHEGIKEIEDALSKPDKPTEHFLPFNIISIGQMINSQVQQASPGAIQIINGNENKFEEVKEILRSLKVSIDQLNLNPQKKIDIQADIGTVESQLSSSKPKISIITECLNSIRAILEEAGGGLAASFIAKLIGLN